MAKLARYFQKLFGSTASVNQISQFGSLAAGTPARYSGATITPALVQNLGNFLQGWNSAQVGAGNPAIEDMNSLCYLFAYQLSYLMQSGIAEWDSSTAYYIGSLVNDGTGGIYASLVDNNTNHAVTDATRWNLIAGGTSSIISSSSSSTFATTSTSYVDVTNLSISVTTYGRPVYIGLVPDGNVTPGNLAALGALGSSNTILEAEYQILRGSTTIAETISGIVAGGNGANSLRTETMPGSLFQIDNPTAGTYTYKVQVKINSTGAGPASAYCQYVKLISYPI